MLEEILPSKAVVVERREDVADPPMFPEEEEVVCRAVEKRRREFVTSRACARAALAELGFGPVPIPRGAHGAPRWPTGIVGSITHCEGYRAAAIARATDLVTIGVDAEVNDRLPGGVLEDIAMPQERDWIQSHTRDAPQVHWDRLLFSMKEAVYKAWFPLAGRWLGFEDAIVTIDQRLRSFSARLLVPAVTPGGHDLSSVHGRWLVRDGLLVTAIAVPARS